MKKMDLITEIITYYNKNGLLHREDGPAVIFHGTQHYYKNGLLHREDGPAVIHSDGYKAYYLNGNFLNINIKIKKSQKFLISFK